MSTRPDDPAPRPKAEPDKAHVAKDYKHGRPLIACRFDPRGRFVFAGAEDNTAQRWDLESGKKTSLAAHESWVFALALTPDGETLITGGGDGRLVWWPASSEAPSPVRKIDAHPGAVRAAVVSPDGALVASAGHDRVVKIWSAADGSPLREMSGHPRVIYRLLFHPDGNHLLSADLKGTVIQWEASTGKEVRRLDAAKLWRYDPGQAVDYGGVRDLSLSPDGKLLACSGQVDSSNPLGAVSTPAVLLLDWETGKEKLLQRPKGDIKGVAWSLRFHPDGFLIIASGGTGGGHLFFLKPDAVNEFAGLNLPNTARDMDLHPDGLRVATAHHDGAVRVALMAKKPG